MPKRQPGLRILDVLPGSLAQAKGIQAGERLLEINGERVLDHLNYQFLIAQKARTQLKILGAQGERTIWVQNHGDGIGLDLEADQIRTCKANCVFCFVQQMPKGFRKALYFKDEDIRLSFLYGHFSTLSSSTEEEVDRVIRERLSPIHVSVHATDPEARLALLRSPKAQELFPKLDRLITGGIQIHTQVVLVPGLNDGSVWERTLKDLWERRAPWRDGPGGIVSLSCVPVGLTAHRQDLPELPSVDAVYASHWVQRWVPEARRLTREHGEPWLLLADEWFTRAGLSVPGRRFYPLDGSQRENGVGLIRRFLDHSQRFLRSRAAEGYRNRKLLFLTGVSFEPILRPVLEALNQQVGAQLRSLAVPNQVFGASVTVAGLLCGRDLLTAAQADLREHGPVEAVFIPSSCLKLEDPQEPFLDDMQIADLEKALHCPVLPAGNHLKESLAHLLEIVSVQRG